MTYCTVDQVVTALDPTSLAQLTDDLTAQTIDAGPIAAAITAAEAEIDGYLGMVTALPLATVPALLERLAVQMALYHLFLRRNQGAYREVEYQNCRALLRDIATGKISLGLPTAEMPQLLRWTAL